VQALDFVNARARRSSSDMSLAACVTNTRDSAAWMSDDAGGAQSFAANGLARIAGIGVDVEGEFTNKIRNPRGEGGTVGTIGSGGAMPVNWSIALAMSGCATSFAGSGVENGQPYTDIRIAGTLSGASPFILAMEVQNNAAAVPGQVWGADVGVRLLSGTTTGLASFILRIIDTPTFNTVAASSSILPTSAYAQFFAKGNVVAAGATAVHPRLYINSLNNGAVIDATIRIYAPKLMQLAAMASYMPAYPILPVIGAPADSTRSADTLSCTDFSWFAQAGLDSGASELVAIRLSHNGDQASRCLFEYSDGTTENYIRGVINAADHVELSIKTDGVLQATAVLTSSISAAKQAFGFGWSAVGGYVTNGSETVSFGPVTLPALTQKKIGNGFSAPTLNDVVRQVQACALLTDAQAASWAASV